MADDAFCGIGKIPNGKRRGNMMECAEKKQVRYWGIKKVDNRTLKAVKNKKADPATRKSLMLKIVGIDGKMKKLTMKYKSLKKPTKADKKELDKEIKQLKTERKKHKDKLDIVEKKIKEDKKAKSMTYGEKVMASRRKALEEKKKAEKEKAKKKSKSKKKTTKKKSKSKAKTTKKKTTKKKSKK